MYTFTEMRFAEGSNDYTKVMIDGCNKVGMKPVCDHPSYCKSDGRSIYIGQSHHLGYGGHWNNAYLPSGLMKLKGSLRQHNMCFFTGPHGGNHQALCATGNSHQWRQPTQSR